jgi:uncharacterized membrane protein required for colicin V production
MNWFDLLLFGLIAVYMLSGFFRGLVKQLFSMFGFLIVLALAFLGSRFLSRPAAQLLGPLLNIPDQEVLQIPGVDAAVGRVVELVAGVLVFLVLFVILSVLLRRLSGSLHWINKLPVVGLINRLGGALVGLAIGVAISYLLISIAQLTPLPLLADAVSGSAVTVWAEQYLPQTTAALRQQIADFYLRYAGNGR